MFSKNKFRVLNTFLLTVSFLGIFSISVEAAPGEYDVGFGSGGFAEFDVPGGPNDLCCIQQQADGKLLVAWHALDQNHLKLRRHNQDGSVDTSFGYDGEAVKELVTGMPLYAKGRPVAVIVLPDGRIVVVGEKRQVDRYGNTYNRAAVWSFRADGFADAGFAGDGEKILLDSIYVERSIAVDVEAGPAGKVYVVYRNYLPAGNESILIRLNEDGGYDTAFGSTGKVKRSGVLNNQIAVDSARRGDGIYWAGTVGNPLRLSVRRYLPSGALDQDYGIFGGAGLSGTCFETFIGDRLYTFVMEMQPDGKLVVGGSDLPPAPFLPEPFIARFNTNGSIDQTFSFDGIMGCPRTGGFLAAIEVQDDNKIVMLNGTLSPLGQWDFRRLLSNGHMDPGFLPEGPPNNYGFGTDLLIQSEDNKVVTFAPSFPGYRLSRYLP